MEVKNCYSDQAELSDIVTEYRNLSYLKIASPVSRIPHLTNADIDHNMPSEFNFNYYSTHDFHSNHDIYESSLDSRSFCALHCNIRSLQGPKVWNSFGKDMKSCSLKKFKAIVKDDMLSKY